MPAEFATKITSIGKARQLLGSQQTVQLDKTTVLTYVGPELGEDAELRHYGTAIVTFRSNGSVEVNPQGYLTTSTMRRVRAVLPDRYKINVVGRSMVLTDLVTGEKHHVGGSFRLEERDMDRVLAA